MNKELRNQIIKYLSFFIIVVLLTSLAVYLTLKDNYSLVFEVYKTSNIWYLFLILAIVIICIILRSIVIHIMTKIYIKDCWFHRSIAMDQVGTLYRMITPAGFGGNIMQTMVYKKQGVSVAKALSIIAMYSIVYQYALIIYNIITIIVERDVITEIGYVSLSFSHGATSNVSVWALIIIGFVLNCAVIGFIYLLSYSKLFFSFIDGPILSLLHKIKIIKNKDETRIKMNKSVDDFRSNLHCLFRHWPTIIITFIIFIIYITISYSVPYVVGKALNNTSSFASIIDSVFLSNLHQMITNIIPLPGNSLLSELFFLKLFYPASGPTFYDSEEMSKAALLLWRTSMFIFPLIISFIFTLIYHPRKNKKYTQNEEEVLS